MAAKPKLTPEQWKQAQKVWEKDSREGYAWLVKELELPVSGAAVRKVAVSGKWSKKPPKEKPSNPVRKIRRASDIAGADKVSKVSTEVSKVSEIRKTKVSETMPETLPETVENSSGGRPTKYREEYANQAYKLCLLGYTNAELADFYNIAISTITEWMNKQPEFSSAIKRGRDIADAEVVESLYLRARGYSHPDVHVSNFMGKITVTEITKHYPPDTAAAFIWLKNRHPEKWRDKVETTVEHKLDREELERIKEVFVERMEISRKRQRQVLIERGLLIEHDEEQEQD